jgi:putative Mn2+ efflux pump MntP
MIDQQQTKLEILLKEYETVKTEQAARIGFRDNLLYVTLTLFGGIFAYAFSKECVYLSFLILPWVSLIMGWTYLVNDQKITALGRYVRYSLTNQLAKQLSIAENSSEIEQIFGWEIAHRDDNRRKRRKIEQLIIDEITFVLSGIGALIGFQVMVKNPHYLLQILSGFEFILLIALGIEIIIYADLGKGR